MPVHTAAGCGVCVYVYMNWYVYKVIYIYICESVKKECVLMRNIKNGNSPASI